MDRSSGSVDKEGIKWNEAIRNVEIFRRVGED